ncbi:4'-phosphopantetheinyl transferase superfamily protein [Pontibaca sp. S1109L]|uniref:Enterobactin synthase component D n=2 Tax=Pontibaca salina TaxID=2795731 RepID=A0A934HT20_9RHOB|nr:4'-phosphopantetheinyl transferase superfamily protein [Pontibaca salina]
MAGLALARGLFPNNVALASSDPGGDPSTLYPAERLAIARAVPARQREFAAGRDAARRAMAQRGLANSPIPMSSDRAPLWPQGVTGSISHCQSCCLAAIALRTDARALGLDVEEDTPLSDDLIAEICTPFERAWLSEQSTLQARHWAKVIFSAKETAYKCQYTVTRRLFGFDGFEISLDQKIGHFEARFTASIAPFARNTALMGRFGIGNGLIVTGMFLTCG